MWRVAPCSVYLKGEYGIKDLYIGVPALLGADGVERVMELDLAEDELNALQHSAETYKETLSILGY